MGQHTPVLRQQLAGVVGATRTELFLRGEALHRKAHVPARGDILGKVEAQNVLVAAAQRHVHIGKGRFGIEVLHALGLVAVGIERIVAGLSAQLLRHRHEYRPHGCAQVTQILVHVLAALHVQKPVHLVHGRIDGVARPPVVQHILLEYVAGGGGPVDHFRRVVDARGAAVGARHGLCGPEARVSEAGITKSTGYLLPQGDPRDAQKQKQELYAFIHCRKSTSKARWADSPPGPVRLF